MNLRILAVAVVLVCLAAASLAQAQASAAPALALVVDLEGEIDSIQEALARAPAGATITVRPGTYHGPIVIEKSVRLEGVGRPFIQGTGFGSVVTIRAPDTTFSGFEVAGTGIRQEDGDAGILVQASRVRIVDNRLHDVLFGVSLQEADKCLVQDNHIEGKPLAPSRRGDGIRAWYSQNVTLLDNVIRDTRDLVLWFSDGSSVQGNDIRDSRYGIHMMLSDGVTLRGNTLQGNHVGAFIMYSEGTQFIENVIRDNAGAQGYGIAFKESDHVVVRRNTISGNQMGIYLDNTPYSTDGTGLFEGNAIAYNEQGVTVLPSVHGNVFRDNTFWNNDEQVAIQGGGRLAPNDWNGNYWSDYTGYDADGDGYGEAPYRSDKLFERLTAQAPALQALTHSPVVAGVEYAASNFPIIRPQPKIVDERPRLEPLPLPAGHDTGRPPVSLWVSSVGLVAVALGAAVVPARAPRTVHAAPATAPAPSTRPLLSVRNVSKRYDGTPALTDIRFALEPGEVVALWGPNGAGKSTLIKTVLGLVRFDGEIWLQGLDVVRDGKQARRLIGYVPQDVVLPEGSVRTVLTHFARLRGTDPKEAEKIAVEHGLAPHLEKRVAALSGGLRQRLALSLALLGDPPLLLLDEPTANLDGAARVEHLATLRSLRSSGRTILYVTHRDEEVTGIADRVLTVEGGRLTYDGPTEQWQGVAA